MPSRAHLKLHGVGEIPAEYAARVLFCMNSAYDGLLILDQLRSLPKPSIRKTTDQLRDYWCNTPMSLELPVVKESLELRGVVLHSPGSWDFSGLLNPLEAIRKYLTDRHERMKDQAYRNQAEANKLNLMNRMLQVDLISKTVDLLKEVGHSDQEIRSLIRDKAVIPLLQLESLQDKGAITYAEITEDKSTKSAKSMEEKV